jgi:hypothetical protein
MRRPRRRRNVKPKKCADCVFLYRHPLVNQKNKFQLVTPTGRTKQQYRCKKFDELYFESREKCGGPFRKEAVDEKGN